MKQTLLLITLTFTTLATHSQDFASRFMELCTDADSVKCQTIGPKMMQKLVETVQNKDQTQNDTLTNPADSCTTTDKTTQNLSQQILTKLKSARIITATSDTQTLKERADSLIEHNKTRFTPWSPQSVNENGGLYIRKTDDIIREIVMYTRDPQENTFMIVNLTGEMDQQFMQTLSTTRAKQQ